MSEDLPNVGLEAGIEGLGEFTKGAKAIEKAYTDLAMAETKVQAASEAQVKATAAASSALGGVAKTIEQVSWAEQQVAASFSKLEDEVVATKTELAAWGQTLDREAAAATNSTQAHGMLQRSYEMLGRVSPQIVDMLQRMEQEWVDSGGAIEEFADTIDQVFGEAVDQIEAGAGQASGALEQMLALMSLGALQQVSGSIGRVGDRLIAFSKDTVMTAARIEELGLVLDNLAVQNDMSAEAMREQVEAIRAQGIQADVAYNLVSQFVRANLDLSKASELARLAQDAAVISMEDSSQALAGLVHGILTLQPEVLRYRGIIVDLQSAYKAWSDETGRSVMEMSSSEKQAVALNAALAQGASITGTYESAMTSASKQLRSFPRYIADLKAEMGESLLPVYSDVIFATKDLLKALEGLPDPIKATVSMTGLLAGGLTKGVSSMVSFGSQAAMLIVALKQLGFAANAASLAFLGPIGLVAALGIAAVGLLTYVRAQEKEHRELTGTILEQNETYGAYIRAMEDAGLGTRALTEKLWEEAQAHLDAADAADRHEEALNFQDAATGAIDLLNVLADFPSVSKQMVGEGEQARTWLQLFTDELRGNIDAFNDEELAILANKEAVLEWAKQNTGSAAEAKELTRTVVSMATEEQQLRREQEYLNQALETADYAVDAYTERLREAQEIQDNHYKSVMRDNDAISQANAEMISLRYALSEMAQAAMDADPAIASLANQIVNLIEKSGDAAALQWTFAQFAGIAREYEAEILEIQQEGEADRMKAEEDYQRDVEALDRDHAGRRADILGDIGEAHRDLLGDLAEAEEEYQAGLLEAMQETAQAIADAEADLAQGRAEAHQDLLDDLADAERKYAQSIEDANRDLARDMEELERDHQENLAEIDADAYAARAELAEEYGAQLKAITERYAEERQAIEEKYSTEPKAPSFDERREALLEELAELEKKMASYSSSMVDRGRRDQILKDLEDLKAEELAELEAAQQAELDALTEWYAQEQAVQEEAYQAALEAEEIANQQRRDERLRAHQEKLDDLAVNLQREREARQRAYEEQLADLDARHAEELVRIEQQHAERLARLEQQNAEERARLQEATDERVRQLNQQLRDENIAFGQRVAQLDKALLEEKATITTRMAEQGEAAKTEADAATQKIVDAWRSIDPRLADAIAATQRNVVEPGMRAIADAFIREIQRMQAELATLGWIAHSPAPWWTEMGQSWADGLEAGLKGVPDIFKRQLEQFEGFKAGAETSLEVGSPSRWAERMGEAVATGFSDMAVLEPQAPAGVTVPVQYDDAGLSLAAMALEPQVPEGVTIPVQYDDAGLSLPAMALRAFMEEQPEMGPAGLELEPYLSGLPAIPAQEMAVHPYLTDIPQLSSIQAPIPADMAAAGVSRQQTWNRTTNLIVNASYTRQQSERSLRQDLELYRMGMQ